MRSTRRVHEEYEYENFPQLRFGLLVSASAFFSAFMDGIPAFFSAAAFAARSFCSCSTWVRPWATAGSSSGRQGVSSLNACAFFGLAPASSTADGWERGRVWRVCYLGPICYVLYLPGGGEGGNSLHLHPPQHPQNTPAVTRTSCTQCVFELTSLLSEYHWSTLGVRVEYMYSSNITEYT